MSCCAAPGGFFDGKTDAEARRLYLLDLLKQSPEQQSSSSCQQSLSDQEVGQKTLVFTILNALDSP